MQPCEGYALSEIRTDVEEWSSRVHPDDLEGCYADIQAHIDGKTDFYENVHRMKHRDGHWVYILDRGKVVEQQRARELRAESWTLQAIADETAQALIDAIEGDE